MPEPTVCPIDGDLMERLVTVVTGLAVDLPSAMIMVPDPLFFFRCTHPDGHIFRWDPKTDEIERYTMEELIRYIAEFGREYTGAMRPMPTESEVKYPGLYVPPAGSPRPGKKMAVELYKRGVWYKAWGEPPWVSAPLHRPPKEFEAEIEAVDRWDAERWGPPPSKRGNRRGFPAATLK